MRKILDKLDEKEFEWTELGVVGPQMQEELARKEVESRFSSDATSPVTEWYGAIVLNRLVPICEKVQARLEQARVESQNWLVSMLGVEIQKLGKDLEEIIFEGVDKMRIALASETSGLRAMLEANINLREVTSKAFFENQDIKHYETV